MLQVRSLSYTEPAQNSHLDTLLLLFSQVL